MTPPHFEQRVLSVDVVEAVAEQVLPQAGGRRGQHSPVVGGQLPQRDSGRAARGQCVGLEAHEGVAGSLLQDRTDNNNNSSSSEVR